MTGGRLIVLTFGLAGCAAAPKPTIPRPPGPPPAGAELLAFLAARRAAIRSANLETRTTSLIGSERVAGIVLMLVDRGGRIRFDAELSLRGTVASLAVAGGGFALLDHRHRVLRRGPSCPENLASLIRIPLSPEEVAAVLLGDAPVSTYARVQGVSWDETLGAEVLAVEQAGRGAGTRRLFVALRRRQAGRHWDVVGIAGENPRAPGRRWRVLYEGLAPAAAGDFSLPDRIRFAEPGAAFEQGVEIKVKDRIVNPTLAEAAFALAPPPGYRVEEIGCAQDGGR